ncbi:MAG TPA: flagellar biosynthetic protein FliO [Pirellulales bacterium]|nr:flagellar biosynthetic protein FliO [Pirellulales bacterium]
MPSIRFLAALGVVCQLWPTSAEADSPSVVRQATYASDAKPSDRRKGADAETGVPRQLPATEGKSLPLPPRGSARSAEGAEQKAGRPLKPTSSILTGLAALAVVLGVFLTGAWALRRAMPSSPNRLPAEVVEVLGRTPLAPRQFAHLVRCGNKLLLVHLAPGSAETLTEITDPAEVDRIAGLCRQSHPQSTTANFRQIFQQFAKEKPSAEET